MVATAASHDLQPGISGPDMYRFTPAESCSTAWFANSATCEVLMKIRAPQSSTMQATSPGERWVLMAV